eukprot:1186075-Prorocentrum_minimum.AAC.1
MVLAQQHHALRVQQWRHLAGDVCDRLVQHRVAELVGPPLDALKAVRTGGEASEEVLHDGCVALLGEAVQHKRVPRLQQHVRTQTHTHTTLSLSRRTHTHQLNKTTSACTYDTRVSTCMKASMARSLATATVKPRGSKDACDTHDAIIADFAVPRAALTTYKPPLCKVAATLAISQVKPHLQPHVPTPDSLSHRLFRLSCTVLGFCTGGGPATGSPGQDQCRPPQRHCDRLTWPRSVPDSSKALRQAHLAKISAGFLKGTATGSPGQDQCRTP